ncbi:vascular endothelial growth factor A isoform X2 [Cephus cinctus]|uniref:Vascular endothelial growth factor A isoform X2 n=1 Tax=Cephus cinctus TaxID=211228 RepID=A0AAJ7BTI6_CEPCN|nr:vascular endothelial growth factor A isoform X2 [Cephus cinctus]
MTESTKRIWQWISFKCFILNMLFTISLAQEVHFHGDQDFVYPGGIRRRIDRPDHNAISMNKKYDNLTELARSIQIAKDLSTMDSVDDILAAVGVVETGNTGVGLSSRVGGVERSKVEIPKSAVCMPELQVVELVEDNDPTKIYLPTCTRAKRCGGCCTHSALSCQPSKTDVRNVVVQVRDQSFKLIEKKLVALEEHTECMCNCRVKAEHCIDKHRYSEDECRCICKNTDEEEKCEREHKIKRWDPETCTCRCLRVEECSTGLFFDQNACRYVTKYGSC